MFYLKENNLFEKFGCKNSFDVFETSEEAKNKTKLLHWHFLELNKENIKNVVFSDGITEKERNKKINNNDI